MSGRILVVDDEPGLRQLLHKYLVRLGYLVDTAASAEEAVGIFRTNPRGYAIAVVDLTLPDISGEQLMQEMLAVHPGVRILLCSGYPYDMSHLPPDVQQQVGFLQKPFLPRQLGEELTQFLGSVVSGA